ncbi:MAG UNVERIFIED_CONTAM: ankyrin repeat domain-containing protein [Rickettsiaceae bacterium]|jgi:ankyrin repeat protein
MSIEEFTKACLSGDLALVESMLRQNPELVSKHDQYNRFPLMVACEHRKLEVVRLLLKNGANIDKGHEITRKSPLMEALEAGNVALIKLLLENGADVSIVDNNQSSTLLVACLSCNVEIVELVIEEEAKDNIIKPNSSRITPIMRACERGDVDVARLLVLYGADVNLCKQDDTSPLMASLVFNNPELTEFLIPSRCRCK